MMWAKMLDKAFISKDGRNTDAKPGKLEPHNLEMHLGTTSSYVQGLLQAQNNKQLVQFTF